MVKKKLKIGLIYEYDTGWIGGAYYIRNLISCLKLIEDSRKPHLIVFYSNEDHIQEIKNINYPFAKYVPSDFQLGVFFRIINFVSRILLSGNNISKKISNKKLSILYQVYFGIEDKTYKHFQRKLLWIPDLQERYYPEFFTQTEIDKRKSLQLELVKQSAHLVFSSRDARNDFSKFYPENNSVKYILPFAVMLPEFEQVDIVSLKNDYGVISFPYFFVANQFWQHKNHKIILEALIGLKNHKFKILFSGSTDDYRNPEYFKSLIEFIEQHDLSGYIEFLGFIDRKIQLKLMKESVAIIQPSLFEGWSTVVEDAKVLNKFILLSDIKVHREQISENVIFFNPSNALELAVAMSDVLIIEPTVILKDYSKNQVDFAETFLSIIEEENKD